MPTVDVMDETFLVAPPAMVAAAFADPTLWPRLWPDLDLRVLVDRGDEGIRWTVSGGWTGSMEVWLEPVLDGTVLHYFLRVDPDGDTPRLRRRGMGRRAVVRETLARQRAAKRVAFALKDRLEGGRPPGVAPEPPLAGPPSVLGPPMVSADVTERVTPRCEVADQR